jgi:hypothetical protein
MLLDWDNKVGQLFGESKLRPCRSSRAEMHPFLRIVISEIDLEWVTPLLDFVLLIL